MMLHIQIYKDPRLGHQQKTVPVRSICPAAKSKDIKYSTMEQLAQT